MMVTVRLKASTFLLLLSSVVNTAFSRSSTRGNCPSVCTCSQNVVDCSGKEMDKFPEALPQDTSVLNLKRNKLYSLHAKDLEDLENLTEIYLDENNFTVLPDFGTLPNVKVLSVSRNKIQKIAQGSLAGFPRLEILDLSYNQITTIGNGSFPKICPFTYLNLDHNNITEFKDLLEVAMPQLRHLKMNHNQLTILYSIPTMPRFSENYKAMEIMELEHNQITQVKFIFFKFPSVRKLYLGYNKLQSLMTGAFVGLKNIEELYLQGNQLVIVTNLWFYQKSHLRKLDLRSNFIRGVDQNAFVGTPNLEYLDLSDNHLDTLGTNRFTPLSRLRKLMISQNEISFVAEKAFIGLGSLQTLNLSRNLLSLGQSELDQAFSPMVNLHTLDLANNSIMLIPKTAFRGLGNLVNLNLSANKIISIQEGAFSDMPHLKLVSFHAPQLICDCTLRWLRNWVKNRSLEGSITGKCESPLWLAGKDIFEVEDRDFVVCATNVHKTIKPEIIVQPKTQAAARGANVTLRCVAISSERSPMRMEWFKGLYLVRDKVIRTSAQQLIGEHVYRRMTELVLRDVDFEDAGKYRCHVSNRFGTDWSNSVNLTIFVFPRFTERPKDLVVHSGKTVQIQCSADGVPAPTIRLTKKFNKDDFPAVEEKRFWFDSANQRFGIRDLKIKDSGYYVCRACNAYGDINVTMVLTVVEEPKFVRPMGSKSVVIGSTAVLECIATGNPRPRVRWYKDDRELDISMHQRFTLSDQLLIILSTKQEDAGVYSCQVSNSLGSAEQRARLIVVKDTSQIPPKGGELPPKLFVAIIIITVVCVTILTSLVWVILICVCKARRMRKLTKRGNFQPESSRDSLRADLTSGLILRPERNHRQPLQLSRAGGRLQSHDYAEPLIRQSRARFKVGIGEPILLRPSVGNEESFLVDEATLYNGDEDSLIPEHRQFIPDIAGGIKIESTSDGNIRVSSSSTEFENTTNSKVTNHQDPRTRDNSSSGSSGIECDQSESCLSEQQLPLLKSRHSSQTPSSTSSEKTKIGERYNEPHIISRLAERSRPDRSWSEKALAGIRGQGPNKPISVSEQITRSSSDNGTRGKDASGSVTFSEPVLPKSAPKNLNSFKKKPGRRHGPRSHDPEPRDDFFSSYMTSSSGIESGESSSSSETVSVSNLEVLEEQSSAVV